MVKVIILNKFDVFRSKYGIRVKGEHGQEEILTGPVKRIYYTKKGKLMARTDSGLYELK